VVMWWARRMSDPQLTCGKCDDGWICEQHPDRPWPHDACAGAGMPCDMPVSDRSTAGADAIGARVLLVPAAGGDGRARVERATIRVPGLRESAVMVGIEAALISG
jgi:hypothetical protein